LMGLARVQVHFSSLKWEASRLAHKLAHLLVYVLSELEMID